MNEFQELISILAQKNVRDGFGAWCWCGDGFGDFDGFDCRFDCVTNAEVKDGTRTEDVEPRIRRKRLALFRLVARMQSLHKYNLFYY